MKPKVEADFPRGGKQNDDEVTSTKPERASKDLFDISSEEGAKKKAVKRKAAKEKSDSAKKKKNVKETFLAPNAGSIKVLTNKDLVEGSLVMGCVKQVMDYDMKVQFPNNLSGVVPITGLCAAYQELLEMVAAGDSSRADELFPLQELFSPGQFVVALVESERDVADGVKGKVTSAKLSLDPRKVNREIAAGGLKSGMTLFGFVSSCEDHGYLIDIGVPSVKAFLPRTEAVSAFGKDDLHVGSYVYCLIKAINQGALSRGDMRAVTVEVKPTKTTTASVQPDMKINLRTLLPGMLVDVSVDKVFDNGVVVKFLDYQGSIIDKHLMKKPGSYKEDQEFTARVLYIHPVTKVVVLTQLKHFIQMHTIDFSKQFEGLRIGTDIADASVTKLNKWGAYFALPNNRQGFARTTLLVDGDKPTDKFSAGSKHPVRVNDFNYVDNLVMLTAKEGDLKEPYLYLDELNPGDKVSAKVHKILSNDVIQVKMGSLRGFIERIFNADIPAINVTKKFEIGSKLKCRILNINREKKSMQLTCKPVQWKSSVPIISSYEQCTIGTIAEGCIVHIKSNGCLVVFYNDIKAFIPLAHLNLDDDTTVSDAFYRGQIVKCRIIKLKDAVNGMLASLDLEATGGKDKEKSAKTSKAPSKVVSCTVEQVLEEGIEVKYQKKLLLIPHEHLTDHMTISEAMLRTFKPGDTIKAVVWSLQDQTIITAKPSIINAVTRGDFPKSFKEVKDDCILEGFVEAIQDNSIITRVCDGRNAGVHCNHVTDKAKIPVDRVLSVGQSVSVLFREEEGQIVKSLRFSQIYEKQKSQGIEILSSFLQDYRRIMNAMEHSEDEKERELASYDIGQVISVTVTNYNEHGAVCVAENGVKGFATKQCIHELNKEEQDVMVGEKIDAVVLYVDPIQKCLELSLKISTVEAVKKSLSEKIDVIPSRKLKAEVVLIKKDFVLSVLIGHARGKLAFLPAKLNFNDFLEHNQYTIGQENAAIVKEVSPRGVIINLNIHERRLEAKNEELRLGKIKNAVVTAIKPQHFCIKIGNEEGKLHLTNVADEVEDGTILSDAIEVGASVKVRELFNHSSPSQKHFTMRPSLMSVVGGSYIHSTPVGAKLIGIINKSSNNSLQVLIDPKTKLRVSLSKSQRSQEDFRSNRAYNFVVTDILEGGSLHIETFENAKPVSYNKGEELIGIVKIIEPKHYARVRLPNKTWGIINLRQMEDPGLMEDLTRGSQVKCQIEDKITTGQRKKKIWNISLIQVLKKGSKPLLDRSKLKHTSHGRKNSK